MSLSDYEVLAYLSEAPNQRLRILELAAAVQWEKSRVSHHVTRMEQRGLVARQECPTDGRGHFVSLTDAGRRAIEAAAPLHVAEVRRWFIEPLQAKQLDELAKAAEAIVDSYEDAGPE